MGVVVGGGGWGWGVGAWGVGDEGLVIGRVSCVGLGVCYYGDASFLSVFSYFSFSFHCKSKDLA